MSLPSNISKQLKNGLTELDMHLNTNVLYFIDDLQNKKNIPPPDIWLALTQASKIEKRPTAIYFKKTSVNNHIPQIYIYDLSLENLNEEQIAKIQRSLWTGQIAPLAYFFSDTFLKIVNCTEPIEINNNSIYPKYLEKELYYKEKIKGQTKMFAEINSKLNQYKADKFDTGIFWEKNNIDIKKNSSLKNLLEKLISLNNDLIVNFRNKDIDTLQMLVIQCILIKYLEEKGAITQNDLLQFNNSTTFYQILENKELLSLFAYLNNEDKLNGRIFYLDDSQNKFLSLPKNQKFIYDKLLHFFDTKRDKNNQLSIWEEYDFKYLPVELISRIYEQFLVINKNNSDTEDNSTKGIVYTPAHLARLLVDECMPISNYKNVDIYNYKILDPTCGSGIFLVTTYKRLVEWYVLQERDRLFDKNEKKKTKAQQTKDLQKILKNNIYGIDKEEKAVYITVFSLTLAFCELCNPTNTFVNDTHFDILKEENIITSDFFEWKNSKNLSFDLVIGNPPFYRAGKEFIAKSKINNIDIQIPGGQIALKFLTESVKLCNVNGLQCLIIKSAPFLFGNFNFRRKLLENINVKQIFDFTHLRRPGYLWENAEPDTIAIFTQNTNPNYDTNILHLTFRRTTIIKETYYFDFDVYDIHFVNRHDAIQQKNIFKCNLLGGNRIISLLNRFQNDCQLVLKRYLSNNNIKPHEGLHGGKSISNKLFIDGKIETNKLGEDYYNSFDKLKLFDESCILIKEDTKLDDKNRIYEIPIAINEIHFPFNNQIIAIPYSNNMIKNKILLYFKKYNYFIQFYIYSTSPRAMVNKENVYTMEDLLSVPFFEEKDNITFSEIEKNIIEYVTNYQQEFIRRGENALIAKPIKNEIKYIINNYAKGFETIINEVYQKKQFAFRITNALVNDNYIAVTFNYTNKTKQLNIIVDKEKATKEIQDLFTNKISPSLRSNRIIFNYDKDEVTIIKPNQLRYWLPFIAYRDADIVFADLVKAGY